MPPAPTAGGNLVRAYNAPSPTHSWPQAAHARAGATLDLSLLCYRRREVAGHGEGLCCALPGGEAANLRFYRGELLGID